MYNIQFSLVPPLLFALFDFEHPKAAFYSNAALYAIGLQKQLFTLYSLFNWILKAFWQGVLIIFINYEAYQTLLPDGKNYGLWTMGSCAYAAIVIVINL